MSTSSSQISNSGTPSNNTVFIVDIYNPYSPYNDNVRSIFWLNERQWCIRELTCSWGKPVIHTLIEDDVQPKDFYLYNTYEEALSYIKNLIKINRGI